MELKNKKPQVKFDGMAENHVNREIESDAAFFASDSINRVQNTQPIGNIGVPQKNTATQTVAFRRSKTDSVPVQPKPVGERKSVFQNPAVGTPLKRQQSQLGNQKSTQNELEKKRQSVENRNKKRNEHIRTFSHIFGSLLLITFIITVSVFSAQFLVRAFLDYTGINAAEYQVTIEIPADATTEEIADELYNYDIILMPGFFTFYSRFSDKDGGYLGGLFNITSTMSYSQIIRTLQSRSQSTETVQVNIIEGMTAREIGILLEENYVCRAEDFMKFYKDRMSVYNFEKRMEHNSSKFNQMEGYLFPDTHEFYVVNGLEDDPNMDTTKYAEVAARTIYSHYNSQLKAEMYRKIGDMGLTLDEFMTIASMVQWEAADPDDMQLTASVFLNRLRNPDTFPKMESDVTEKYANASIKPYKNGDNADSIDSMMEMYNTYNSDGLPPGPICNPGMVAMLAVLDAPTNMGLFYFCANIETGEMYFAKTLSEHRANLELAGIDENDR